MTPDLQPSCPCLDTDWDDLTLDGDVIDALLDHPLGARALIATGEALHG